MALTISQQAYWELFEEKRSEGQQNVPQADEFDVTWSYPLQLGQGYWREIQLRDGLELTIADYQLHEDLTLFLSDCEHPIECDFNILANSTFWLTLSQRNLHLIAGKLHCVEVGWLQPSIITLTVNSAA